MKRFLCMFTAIMASACVLALADDVSDGIGTELSSSYVRKEKAWPNAKRPTAATSEQIASSKDKNPLNAGDSYVEETNEIFEYGMTDEIANVLDTMTKDEDFRFKDAAYDLFQVTKSQKIREKVLAYFSMVKDPCLEDFAVEVLNDPFEERHDTVVACFKYVSAVKSKDAIGGVVELLEKDDLGYFNEALECLGEIGGEEEAVYLTGYINKDDLTLAQRQSLIKVLGKIHADETWDVLAELAQDEDEDVYIRAYAAEAIGSMGKKEAVDILVDLFEDENPKLREYVVRGLSNFTDSIVQTVIKQALKDDVWRVRMEAINVIEKHGLSSLSKDLIYHCKHKEETVVKEKIYRVLAKLNTSDGNEYLISLITDKKVGDAIKSKVAAALLENNTAGVQEIVELAKETLKNDKQKNLRYALGKEFAKYSRPEFAEICSLYIASKDVATQGTGLDMYARGKYSGATKAVQDLAALAEDDPSGKKRTNNVNAQKAKKILGN
ncbi:MAG: HEAT repeat domain-containing protein [Treponema sp.]|nr:HEAT repeat domain-containing protein [Treponema sp.]MBQ2600782.1 HEAT repeat domain-containing protein [Treponema sp.]